LFRSGVLVLLGVSVTVHDSFHAGPALALGICRCDGSAAGRGVQTGSRLPVGGDSADAGLEGACPADRAWQNRPGVAVGTGAPGRGGVWLVEQTADLERVSYYSALVSIEGVVSGLNRLVNDFATSSLHEYSYADAGYILVLGFVVTVMLKAVLMMGPIAVALVAGASRAELAGFCRRYVFGLVAMLLYLAILLVFFIQHRF